MWCVVWCVRVNPAGRVSLSSRVAVCLSSLSVSVSVLHPIHHPIPTHHSTASLHSTLTFLTPSPLRPPSLTTPFHPCLVLPPSAFPHPTLPYLSPFTPYPALSSYVTSPSSLPCPNQEGGARQSDLGFPHRGEREGREGKGRGDTLVSWLEPTYTSVCVCIYIHTPPPRYPALSYVSSPFFPFRGPLCCGRCAVLLL